MIVSTQVLPRTRTPRDVERTPEPPPPGYTVVHVTTVPGTLGFLEGQIRHLKSRGWKVSAIASPGPTSDAMQRRLEVPVNAVRMTRSITPFADLVAVVRLWKLFRKIRPDVVHGHTPKGGLLAMIAATLAGVTARFYTVHGLPLETARGWKRTLLRWTEWISCLLARRVHPVSPSLGRIVARERLCDPSRFLQLGPGTIGGVDAERRFSPGPTARRDGNALRHRLRIPSRSPVVGFVGRLVKDKGLHELVEAWKLIRNEFPDVHLVIAGEFEPRDPVSPACAAALRSDPRIHLLGAVNSMPGVYAAMDVLALPTYREGFPQTPLEAAAMEIPVVATRVTGCVDAVVPGVTGMLVPAGDSPALASALTSYLSNPELRRRHGLAGRHRVLEDFHPRTFWVDLENAYREELAPVEARKMRRARKRPLAGRAAELLIKRVMDIAGASFGLALLLPVLIVIGLVTLITLGRPLFFRQVRPGLKGKAFTPLKFRTMRPGTEADDLRVTRFGRMLRRFSLDELPQLWNVLVGDMSLVGPRPLLMRYLRNYTPRLRQRLDFRPGMTGLCQVNGRNSLTWDRKFAFDVTYVERWSLALDTQILFRTFARVIRKDEVSGPGADIWEGGEA